VPNIRHRYLAVAQNITHNDCTSQGEQDEVEERMAGMKEDRRYGSQRRIAGGDQQYERIRQGDGKQPSPFSYAKELGKEVMPGNKKQEKAKHVMQDYLRERRRQR